MWVYFFHVKHVTVLATKTKKSADPECIYVYTLRKIFFQNVAWFLVQLLFKLRLLFHSLLTDDIGQGVLELTWNWVRQFLEVWITNLRSRRLRKIVILKTNNFTPSVKWFWSTGTCTKTKKFVAPGLQYWYVYRDDWSNFNTNVKHLKRWHIYPINYIPYHYTFDF